MNGYSAAETTRSRRRRSSRSSALQAKRTRRGSPINGSAGRGDFEERLLVVRFGRDEVLCRLGSDEVGLPVAAGFPGAARLLGFQQHQWSPTLTIVATDSWADDDAQRRRAAGEGMLPVFELDDGRIVQVGTPVHAAVMAG